MRPLRTGILWHLCVSSLSRESSPPRPGLSLSWPADPISSPTAGDGVHPGHTHCLIVPVALLVPPWPHTWLWKVASCYCHAQLFSTPTEKVTAYYQIPMTEWGHLISCPGLPLLVTLDVCFARVPKANWQGLGPSASLSIHTDGCPQGDNHLAAINRYLSPEGHLPNFCQLPTAQLHHSYKTHACTRMGFLRLQGSVVLQLALSNPQLPGRGEEGRGEG